MDPVLYDILKDGVTKYLEGKEQAKYIVNSKSKPPDNYWQRIRNFI